MEFKDFYELATKVTKYEELLREVNSEEIAVAYLTSTSSFICLLLVKKASDLWKK